MRNIKPVITATVDLPLFTAVIFLKVISFNYILGLVDADRNKLMIGCLGSTLLLVSLLCLLDIKNRLKFMLILDFVISLLLFTDIVYNRYFQDVTSAALIKQAALVGEVKDSVKALIKPNDLIFFLDLAIFTPVYLLIRYKLNLHTTLRIRTRTCGGR